MLGEIPQSYKNCGERSRSQPGAGLLAALTVLLALTAPVDRVAKAAGSDRVGPGHHSLDGAKLHPFEARWQERQVRDGAWADASRTSEHLTIDEATSRLRFVRTVDAGTWGYDLIAELDRRTLAPRRLTRELREGIPEQVVAQLAQAGVVRRFEYTFTEGGYRAVFTAADGATHETSGSFERPVFDATAMGPILAALPLEVGYEARLPVVFIQAHDGSLTAYDMIARVVANDGSGGRVPEVDPIFRVEVDWADPATGEVSAAGGADDSGGAYWIATDPPAGIPYVPRYANNTVDFILQTADVADAAPATAAAGPPQWFLEHLESMARDGGRWIADNSAYQSDQEPYDAYGLSWEWGLGHKSLVGRLFGIQDGKEVGTFWEFRTIWHPGEHRALVYQYGADGTVGIGTMQELEAEAGRPAGTTADQTFYQPDGSTFRAGHRNRDLDDRTTDSHSFDIQPDGTWQPRRSYIWKRQ